MSVVEALCRYCGAVGEEDPAIDPAPGVCPNCLDARMAAATDALARYAEDHTPAECVAEGIRLLEEVGLTPAAARTFVGMALP